MHGPLWNGVAQAVRDIFTEGFPADKVIQRHMKANRKWGSGDRRLFAETVYDMVRWWRRLLFAMGEENVETLEAFQTAVSAWCMLQDIALGKSVPAFNLPSAKEIKSRWQDPPSRAVRESVPDWLDQWGAEELVERWEPALKVLNSIAPVYLRCNRLKTTPEKLQARLAMENFDCETLDGDALILRKRANVFLSKSFQDGWFEMQDLNSQKAAEALAPKPGERVIDACAGAGGKTLHLASLMGGKGKIIALDVQAKRLESLRERAARAGAASVEVKLIESTKVIKRLHDSADRLLLDVPCSGVGVLRRNPDSKYRLNAEEVARLKQLQKEILSSYSPMCRPGGRMVYSTCSIMPSENEAQIETFLREAKSQWKLLTQETLQPERGGPDGFFIAVLERV